VVELKRSLFEILQLVKGNEGSDLTRLKVTFESLLGHQSNFRSTYQAKTDLTAALVIDHRKVKYEEIIGRGGIF
jgi:hypothetical protein